MIIEYKIDNFRQTFWTPFEQYREHIGKKFKVLGRNTALEDEINSASGYGPGEGSVLYDIQLEDGTEITAWGEEVCQ